MPFVTGNPGPPGGVGFSPTSVTGCQLWLDGADSSSMVLNGSSVSTWNDKSGNGYNFTSVSTSPTFSQGGILFVDGTILVNSSITAFSSDNTLYLVAKATAINASGIGMIFVAGSDYTSDTYGYRILAPSIGTSTSYSWDVNPPGNGGNLNHNGTATLYVDGTTGTANMYSIYNTAVLSAPGNGSGLTGLTLSRSTYNRYYNGYIYEVLLFNSKHGTPQRQIIEGYLAQKWGLTSSLPGGHPGLTTNYISSAPRVFSLGPLTGTHAPFYVTANRPLVPLVITTTTFAATGAAQTFTVPATTSSINVFMWGAAGGGGYVGGGNGAKAGAGAYVQGTLAVTPGATITIVVGKGGIAGSEVTTYGGGGAGISGNTCGSGGGRSAIQFTAGTDIVTVAGGGGGGYYNSNGTGGAGDATTGTGRAGSAAAGGNAVYGGKGGTQSAGGAPGQEDHGGNPTAGSQYQGGNGSTWSGAGGGGGYYGGGGGGAGEPIGGGGGGGSSFTTPLTSFVGYNSSDGFSTPFAGTYNPSSIYGAAGGPGSTGGDGRVVLVYYQ